MLTFAYGLLHKTSLNPMEGVKYALDSFRFLFFLLSILLIIDPYSFTFKSLFCKAVRD